jgi:hypothetical protein
LVPNIETQFIIKIFGDQLLTQFSLYINGMLRFKKYSEFFAQILEKLN